MSLGLRMDTRPHLDRAQRSSVSAMFDHSRRGLCRGPVIEMQERPGRGHSYLRGATVANDLRCIEFLKNMSASADVLAMAKVEVDLNTIPEGKNVSRFKPDDTAAIAISRPIRCIWRDFH